ncbi:MAG: type III secretion system chaperone [Mailhella sp.]|nr:type III secretion system chaperone [Mailhella sp.]
MEYTSLLRELSSTLGFDLAISDSGTCGIIFDEDEVMFEINEKRLFIIADLGSCNGREDACMSLLKASNLGLETGFSCLGIDDARDQFTLCRILEGDLSYPDFEKLLAIFVEAVRYWKKWLSLPPSDAYKETPAITFGDNVLRI